MNCSLSNQSEAGIYGSSIISLPMAQKLIISV